MSFIEFVEELDKFDSETDIENQGCAKFDFDTETQVCAKFNTDSDSRHFGIAIPDLFR